MPEANNDKIVPIDIEKEMKKSYIDYAMSVIVSRALPDVRDGLKPVHRRILFSMNELHLDPSKGYKKSARITGDTMGKYHPHGDASIYDAMVRMAQPFAMRYMLVDGHGNFGSIDGDGAAAARYTEAKLSKISMELLKDIDKDTVDFVANYDGELLEPSVLPSKYPNLLVNGSSGIAVGMATTILPHNLKEIVDGAIKIIDNQVEEGRDTDIDELLEIIKGPDFPTGATIYGKKGIEQGFRTGRGKVVVRATCDISEMKSGRSMIVVSEIPYQVNKSKLLEKIADLAKEKKIDGIVDLRDESDRKGIRIVIEVKKDINAYIVLNQLYKYSQLQNSYGINMLALVNNVPKTLNLKDMLVHYLEHQKVVIRRRTEFELDKAEKRAHILEGLLIALNNIEEVIKIIRGSKDVIVAKEKLQEQFGLSEIQATSIVDMRLRALTGLEREKLEENHKKIVELIKELRAILGDENLIYEIIKGELSEVKRKYGDDRRTSIIHSTEEINMEDLIEKESVVITLTNMDYIKRLSLSTYRSQNRGGKGKMGMTTREEDIVRDIKVCNTHDYLLFFTNLGRVYRMKGYEVPSAGRSARGTAMINLLPLKENEKIQSVLNIKDFKEDEEFVMLTRKGIIKRTTIKEFVNIRKTGKIALTIKDEDELVNVKIVQSEDQIFIVTRKGKGIKFKANTLRKLGRTASGVKGIRLKEDDEVIDLIIAKEDEKVLIASEKGFGKCTKVGNYRTQKRGGTGSKTYKITEKTGEVIGVLRVNDNEEVMMINSNGVIIRLKVEDMSTTGKVTQGSKLITLKEDETVISISKISEAQLGYLEENIEDEESSENIENE